MFRLRLDWVHITMANTLVDRFFFRLSESRMVEGLLVASLDSQSHKEAVQRVGDALRLINQMTQSVSG